MNPKLFWLLTAIVLVLVHRAEAQQSAKIPRVGFLLPGDQQSTPQFQIEALRHGLADFGFIEGKNIVIEYRYADGKRDRGVSLVTELVQLNVDALVLISVDSIRAAKQATKTIPIVMIATVDPVATGLVICNY